MKTPMFLLACVCVQNTVYRMKCYVHTRCTCIFVYVYYSCVHHTLKNKYAQAFSAVYLPSLRTLCEHHNSFYFILPNHSPESLHRHFHWSCSNIATNICSHTTLALSVHLVLLCRHSFSLHNPAIYVKELIFTVCHICVLTSMKEALM